MLPRIGGAILAALAVALGIYTFISSWPWWVTAILAFIVIVGAAFMLLPAKGETITPEAPRPKTTTFKGDLDGSKIDSVWSDADTFADGNARNAQMSNITHHTDHNQD
jgi:hypothetical protein